MDQNLNGLPDEATLCRLANEFFAAWPGELAAPDGRRDTAAPPHRGAVPGWNSVASAAVPGPAYYFARPPQPGQPSFDVEAVRRDFPILADRVRGHRLVWLDNAATTQKPRR